MTTEGTRIGLLGPLEIRRDGSPPVTLGGAKQRALLGVLLLEAGRVLPSDVLVEELWEGEPPPSAAHTLEAMVSRLRGVLGPLGVAVHRSGAGYVLDPGDAALDVGEFQQGERAARATLAEDPDDVAILEGRAALALWRGPVLGDLSLGPLGRAAAARLEEERLRLLELVLDAELARGRHAEALPELQATVGGHPFRERFVAQLMLALYRCGRHTEALAAYERTRATLDEQLGLQPSPELQHLSAQIVRHDPSLDVQQAQRRAAAVEPAARARRRRRPVALVAAALGAATLAVGAGGGSALPEALDAKGQTVLVLPTEPGTGPGDLMLQIERVAAFYGDEDTIETVVLDDVSPEPGALTRFAERLRAGAFELVVWVGDGAAAEALAPAVAALEETTFVYVDASLGELGLDGVPNASAIRFAADATLLTGYLAGLVAPLGAEPWERVDVVGIVASHPTPAVQRRVAAFENGLARARPDARVVVGHVPAGSGKRLCESLANRQIDAGAELVVALADGPCGLGVVAVANYRNVWAIGDDEGDHVPARLRDRLLAHTYRDVGPAVGDAIQSYAAGTLVRGTTQVRGLEDDYAVGVWFNDATPEAVASRVVDLCSELRERARQDPSRAA